MSPAPQPPSPRRMRGQSHDWVLTPKASGDPRRCSHHQEILGITLLPPLPEPAGGARRQKHPATASARTPWAAQTSHVAGNRNWFLKPLRWQDPSPDPGQAALCTSVRQPRTALGQVLLADVHRACAAAVPFPKLQLRVQQSQVHTVVLRLRSPNPLSNYQVLF